MPYSSSLLDKKMLKMLRDIKPTKIYDVGAGAGKYGLMINKYLKKTVKESIAIEMDRDYIKKFKLNTIYSEVWSIPAAQLMTHEFYDTNFDTVILGDCIEHMKKSEGVDLLNFLVYRCKWILVQYPVKYIQNSVNGKFHEAHISVWGDADFTPFEVEQSYTREWKKAILIKGFLA